MADLIGAIASVVAAFMAVWALRLAAQTFRRDHRPLVRVAATWPDGNSARQTCR
jgi:hypothetical protein